MSASSTCLKCGSEIPASEPLGVCAQCLLATGTEASDPNAPLGETLAVTGGQVVTTSETLTFRSIGDYELIEELARGGMGVLFKALQVSRKRTVALKMIHGGSLAWPQAVQRFQTEAEAAAPSGEMSPLCLFGVHGEVVKEHWTTASRLPSGFITGQIA